jgi:hypothetical protein
VKHFGKHDSLRVFEEQKALDMRDLWLELLTVIGIVIGAIVR